MRGVFRLLSLLGILALAVLTICVAVTIVLPTPNRNITLANFVRIEFGMTEAEVESILGGPAGDYLTAPEPLDSDFELFAKRLKGLTAKHKRWKGDEACVFLDFDENGRVAAKQILHSSPRPANIFQSVRRQLPW